MRLNGAYHGLYSFVEQVDETFLKRRGLDPKGDMYKAVHWKYSNLRAPDEKAKCPWEGVVLSSTHHSQAS